MTDADADLRALLQTARRHAREVVQQAELSADLRELQLSVLRAPPFGPPHPRLKEGHRSG